MRILVISNLYPPRVLGGYELAAHKIVEGLRSRGHDVRVLTSPAWAPTADANVERTLALRAYQQTPPASSSVNTLFQYESKASQLDNTLIVLDALRRVRPEHVLLFNIIGIGGLAVLDLLRRSGIPWTWNLGDRVPGVLLEDVDPAITGLLEPSEAIRSGAASVVSRTLAGEIAAEGIELGRVEVIPRGIPARDVGRSRGYREGGVTRFTAAGVLSEFKGTGLILEAAARLAREGVGPFEVTVYGQGDVEEWRTRADALGVADRVRFGGFVDQLTLIRAHAAADAFLFPTWGREPGASAPFEAASVGAVPIVTEDCGPAESLHDGVDALLIPRPSEAHAHAMASLIRGDVDLAALGAAGVALTSGPMSADAVLARLEAMLVAGRGSTDWLESEEADRHVVGLADRVAVAVGDRIRRDEDAWARSIAPAAPMRRGWRGMLRRGT